MHSRSRRYESLLFNHSLGCKLSSVRALTGVASVALWLGVACSPVDDGGARRTNTGNGGSAHGGATANGGAANAQGGASGGMQGSGGAAQGGAQQGGAAQGGSGQGGAAQGGAAQGGASQGGKTSSGGVSSSGGATSTGGSVSKGGSASGGANSGGSGGKSSGGGGSAGSSNAGANNAGASSGGASGACSGFVFCDDFEDGNYNQNPAWIATASAFTITNDGSQVLTQKASSEAWAYSGSIGWTDVTIQARVKVTNFGGTSSSYCGGVIARWTGSSNPNYQANLCANGSVGIYKDGSLIDETNGTKAAGIALNTWYALKFKVAGAPGKVALTLSINDAQVISITDTDTSNSVPAGYVGVGSKKTLTIEYDDIKVSSP